MVILYAGLEQRGGQGLVEYAKTANSPEHLTSDINLDGLGLPSWVPDLRPNRRKVPNRYWDPTQFQAAMNQAPAAVLHKTCTHVLAMKGYVFDTISQPLPPVIVCGTGKAGVMDSMEANAMDFMEGGVMDLTRGGVMDFIETMKYLIFVYSFAKDHYEERGVTNKDFSTVFNSVVTAGRTSGKLMRVASDRDPDWIDRNLEYIKYRPEDASQGLPPKLEESLRTGEIMDIALFFSCLSLLFLHDQVILTEGGYMGIAPQCSRLDKISWINELQSLVVLRPVTEGQYQLVGPCFLHGAMHGELTAKNNDGDGCTFIELI